jgi:hypothetical protein
MQTAIDVRHEQPVGKLISPADAPMVAMIERIAMDPNIPIDRLEKMLAMKERMEDRNREMTREDREYAAKTAYFSAMSACQAELPVVVKNKRNSHTNSNYADLAAIEDQAMPVIYKHGFGISFQPDGYNDIGELLIKWEISHAGGYVRNGIGAIPVDGAGAKGGVNKTGTQAFGSTATYGRRYLLCMLFNISTGDDRDGNRPTPSKDDGSTITEAQISVVRELIEKAELEIEQFCGHWKIEAIPDIPSSKFAEVVGLAASAHRSPREDGGGEGQWLIRAALNGTWSAWGALQPPALPISLPRRNPATPLRGTITPHRSSSSALPGFLPSPSPMQRCSGARIWSQKRAPPMSSIGLAMSIRSASSLILTSAIRVPLLTV